MNDFAVTSLSSKGQIVIPDNIRRKMGVKTGVKFTILTDGQNILLHPVERPKMAEFNYLIKESRQIIKEKGIKKAELKKIIKSVRSK